MNNGLEERLALGNRPCGALHYHYGNIAGSCSFVNKLLETLSVNDSFMEYKYKFDFRTAVHTKMLVTNEHALMG